MVLPTTYELVTGDGRVLPLRATRRPARDLARRLAQQQVAGEAVTPAAGQLSRLDAK